MQIARSIRATIEEGQFRPGEKLPSLARLARVYGCSRATVREALGALRGQGLVEFRHGDGVYVRTASVEMWMEPLEAAILLGEGQALQLVELMTSIVAGVAAFAASRGVQGDTGALSDALFQVECAAPGTEAAVASELSFYAALAEYSGNALLANALRVLQEALRSSLRVLYEDDGGEDGGRRGPSAVSAGVPSAAEVCRMLYAAVCEGDAEAAWRIAFRHGTAMARRVARRRERWIASASRQAGRA
ncbi:MAG: FadR family transcriptional regulator [Alicyclobacillaceae bacterium]|nr:FadR family transcriptional regulator [Alicyclobacillaceae bacterium]